MAPVRGWRFRELAERAAVATLILSVGCGKDDIVGTRLEPPPAEAAPVASVAIQVLSPTLPWPFVTSLTAVPKDAAGRTLSNRAATWTSSNPAIVQVASTPSGSLLAGAQALGVGTVTITATVEGTTGETHITATVLPEMPVRIWPDTSRIPVTGRRVLNVQRFAGLNRSPMTIAAGLTWKSSNPDVLSVDNGGTITALAEGQATITAVAPNRQFSAEVFVFRYPSTLDFTSVTTGDRHACGLTSSGIAYCWGQNDYGQLGVDAPMDRCATFMTAGGGIFDVRWFRCSEAPLAVSTPLRFTSISAGLRQTCALTAAGEAYCWGRNVAGVSGTDVPDTIIYSPMRVAGGHTFRAIDVGRAGQTCAVTTSNAAYCWGNNSSGALGDGSRVNRAAPTAVVGGHTWQVVHAGATTCGLTTDETAYCWGANSNGEAGVPVGAETTSPTRVAGDLRFKKLGSSCGLVADGSAYCWGYIWGGVVTHTPTPLTGGLAFANLARASRCGITVDGSAYCWPFQPTTPVRNAPDFPVRALDVGGGIACAIDLSGMAYCWGVANPGFWQNDAFGMNVGGEPRRVAGQR